jgi:hypothetical protein
MWAVDLNAGPATHFSGKRNPENAVLEESKGEKTE